MRSMVATGATGASLFDVTVMSRRRGLRAIGRSTRRPCFVAPMKGLTNRNRRAGTFGAARFKTHTACVHRVRRDQCGVSGPSTRCRSPRGTDSTTVRPIASNPIATRHGEPRSTSTPRIGMSPGISTTSPVCGESQHSIGYREAVIRRRRSTSRSGRGTGFSTHG